MVDNKLCTLLTLIELGSYTKTANALNLTQPAVSHHIRQLETEFGVQLFYRGTKTLKLTPEGKLLLKYARRSVALYNNTLQNLEDLQLGATRFVVGITPTAEESLVPRVMASYCTAHPDTRITIFTDTIDNIYIRLKAYELDVAIVEGNIPHPDFTSVLLDTDYLCLITAPSHPFAGRGSVTLGELRHENLILRTPQAGTRKLFDNYLMSISDNIRNFHVILEVDSVATIKELVSSNLGVSVIAHSACAEAVRAGILSVVPVRDFHLVREINMVHHKDFSHTAILDDLHQIYEKLR